MVKKAVKVFVDCMTNIVIKVLRLLKAQEMLYFTDIPVDEIAAIVGYDSSSYFNKCFAERFFMTPQECWESTR